MIALNRFALTIVGPSGAGKTSLVRSLMKQSFNPGHDSTELVELSSVTTQDVNTAGWKDEPDVKEIELALAGVLLEQSSRPVTTKNDDRATLSADVRSTGANASGECTSVPSSAATSSDLDAARNESGPERDCDNGSGLQQQVDYAAINTYIGKWEHRGCRLRIWDNAGQDVFGSTQALLFSRNGSVIHVVSLMDFYNHETRARTELEGRLSTTAIHTDGSVILLCFSRLDLLKQTFRCEERCAQWLDGLSSRLEAHLSKTHPDSWRELKFDECQNRCFFAIDNTQGDGTTEHESVAQLRGSVEAVIAEDKFGGISRKIPFRWVRVLDALQQQGDEGKSVMAFSKVADLAISFGVKPEKIKVMLSTFHNIGEVLYYDAPGLDQYVIAPPQATVQYFTAFIRDFSKHRHKQDKRAAAELKHCWRLLTGYGVLLPELAALLLVEHPAKTQQFLIRLMKRFRLICEIPVSNGSEYLVPALLPEPPNHIKETSAADIQEESRISILFEAIPPAGLFEMLQSLVVRHSAEIGSTYPPTLFRHLAVVCWGDYSFRMQQKHKAIHVDVLSGAESASAILAAFQQHLRALVADFFHDKVTWQIRVHGKVGHVAASADQSDLAKAVVEENDRVECCIGTGASEYKSECPVEVFSQWFAKPVPLKADASDASVNWVHAKLGAALSSVYLGKDTTLLVHLFEKYWDVELQRWVKNLPQCADQSRLLLWARPGSMQTADLVSHLDETVFVGQNFQQLTDLLCGRLFKSTADGGTWFWPKQKWQQQLDDGACGGKRALWACYSAALVRSAGRVLYECRTRPRELIVVLSLYGQTDEALWRDYQDAKRSSILLNEELAAGHDCPSWRQGVNVSVHLVTPTAHTNSLKLESDQVPGPEWQDNGAVAKIMLDLAGMWQSSALSSRVQIISYSNSHQNLDNFSSCLSNLSGADQSTWYLHAPKGMPAWQEVPISHEQRVCDGEPITSVSLATNQLLCAFLALVLSWILAMLFFKRIRG